jgi:hypothetical protein
LVSKALLIFWNFLIWNLGLYKNAECRILGRYVQMTPTRRKNQLIFLKHTMIGCLKALPRNINGIKA